MDRRSSVHRNQKTPAIKLSFGPRVFLIVFQNVWKRILFDIVIWPTNLIFKEFST